MTNKVLVTGASGFTGGHVCRRLVSEGFTVRGMIRDASREQALRDQGIEPVVADLRQAESLDQAVEGIDVVYHLAAAFRAGRHSASALHEINVTGSSNLAEAAARAGVERFVHCSSVGVHGEILDPPADEDAPMNPGDAYQQSKLDSERAVKEVATRTTLPLVIFRPAGIYGPGDRRFLKLVKAVQLPIFPMIGSGRFLYQLVFIDDLVEGILACGRRVEALGEVYILTGIDSITLNDFVRILCQALGRKPRVVHIPITPVYWLSAAVEFTCVPLGIDPPLFRRRLDPFRKDRAFTVGKAAKELGYNPKTSLEDGLNETIDWYRKQGWIK